MTGKDDRRRQPRRPHGDSHGFWDVTRFGAPELDRYAADVMERETRTGVRILSLVFLFVLASSAVLNAYIGLSGGYLYSFLLLAFLSAYIYLVSGTVRGIQELYMLGMSLLVVSSTALVLSAHRVGSVQLPLYLGVVLIFLVVPLVPWGVCEAAVTVLLVYMVFTISILSGSLIFDGAMLVLLQFFMFSAGMIALVQVARSATLRKAEIRSLFDLEEAHAELRRRSFLDPLTGAYNRLFLQEHYEAMVERFRQGEGPFHFLLFDVDRFKHVNDTFGHDYGDLVLKWVVESFRAHLRPEEVLVRLGGDEFAVLSERHPGEATERALAQFAELQQGAGRSGVDVASVSLGLVSVAPDADAAFPRVFKEADRALYMAKRGGGGRLQEAPAAAGYAPVAG